MTKKEYFQQLREQWKLAKEHADTDAIKAILQNHGLKISVYGFAFVQLQMKKHGFSGIPYLDCKTFKGWKENGFIVKKGEKSKISGITWIDIEKNDSGDSFKLPKEYKLFHRSQVKEL